MVSCLKAMGWGFSDLKKKQWVENLDLDEASWFSELAEARPVWVYGIPARWLSQWVKSWRCTNSQHSKKLCLSLLMSENLKLNKVNKSFVPEPRKSSAFRVFRIPYVSFTYSYLGRIFGPMLHMQLLRATSRILT